ncbi:hypothetical protein EMN47_19725 [Prolixibacteraceae bacterium JC049]|nr:hypothetical protein [Prolixibacteraceae bacterium JC049]
MTTLTHYLLIATFSTVIIYIFYLLFFRRETNFKHRRFFLLFATLAAIVLPTGSYYVIVPLFQHQQVEAVNFATPTINETITTSNSTVSSTPIEQDIASLSSAPMETPIDWFSILSYVYWIVTAILLIRLVIQLGYILWWYNNSQKVKQSFFTLLFHSRFSSPFSFFRWIFMSNKKLPSNDFEKIIAHEAVHVKQKHSIDTIVFEFLCTFMWFNPFIWMLRHALYLTHEFLADEGAIETGIKSSHYQALLLNQAAEIELIGITSHFNKSMITKRIKMISQSKLVPKNRYKILFLIPAALLLYLFVAGINGLDRKKILIQKMSNDPIINKIFTTEEIDGLAQYRILFEKSVNNALGTNSVNPDYGQLLILDNNQSSYDGMIEKLQFPRKKVLQLVATHKGFENIFYISDFHGIKGIQFISKGTTLAFLNEMRKVYPTYNNVYQIFKFAGGFTFNSWHNRKLNLDDYALDSEAGKLFVNLLFAYHCNKVIKSIKGRLVVKERKMYSARFLHSFQILPKEFKKFELNKNLLRVNDTQEYQLPAFIQLNKWYQLQGKSDSLWVSLKILKDTYSSIYYNLSYQKLNQPIESKTGKAELSANFFFGKEFVKDNRTNDVFEAFQFTNRLPASNHTLLKIGQDNTGGIRIEITNRELGYKNAPILRTKKESWWKDYKKHYNVKTISTGSVKVKITNRKNNQFKKEAICQGKILSFKNDALVDSLNFQTIEPVGDRYGLNFNSQPLPNVIIGSKFGDYDGRTIIIDESGSIHNMAGGFFFITKNQRYIISPWHSDLSGISIFDLKENTIIEKRTKPIRPAKWYYFKNNYYVSHWGKVPKEKAKDPQRYGNYGETDKIYRVNLENGQLETTSLHLANVQKGETIQLLNMEDCGCK